MGRHGTPDGPTVTTERELEEALEALLDDLDIRWYHPHDSRSSPKGWPDYAIGLRPMMYVELKAEGGRLSRDQAAWLEILADTGALACVVVGDAGLRQLCDFIVRTHPTQQARRSASNGPVVLGSGRVAGADAYRRIAKG